MKYSLIFLGLLLIPLSSAQFIEQTSIISGDGICEKTFSYEYNNQFYINHFDSFGDSSIYYDYYNRPAKILHFKYETNIIPLNHPWFFK